MKQLVFGLFLLCFGAMGYAMPAASDEQGVLTPEDEELIIKLIGLVDEGLYEAVMPDFDLLAKKYPDNYIVQYERAYTLYLLGRYDEIIKLRKKLLNHKDASEQTYQLIGNSYDDSGDTKEAIKVYQEGLKRFPESGSLYLELGTVYNRKGEFDKALEYYNNGILANPNFASNYYRAADSILRQSQQRCGDWFMPKQQCCWLRLMMPVIRKWRKRLSIVLKRILN